MNTNFGQSPTTGESNMATIENMTGIASPKSLSPIEERMQQLASAQDLTHMALDHLLSRLSPVLGDAHPENVGEAKAQPPSPLAGGLDDRIGSALGINSRINEIIARLTL